MADIKISELDPVTSANDDDVLIMNQGSTTHSITWGDLGGSLASTGGTIASPILVKFKDSSGRSSKEEHFRGWGSTPGLDSANRLMDWYTLDQATVTLPPGTDAAFVSVSDNASGGMSSYITAHGSYPGVAMKHFRSYTAHELIISGGSFALGDTSNLTPNSMMGVISNNFTTYADSETTAGGNRVFSGRRNAFQLIKLDSSNTSRTITLTKKIHILRGGWQRTYVGAGKLYLHPIKFTNDAIVQIAEFGTQDEIFYNYTNAASTRSALDDFFPPVGDDNLKREEADDLKKSVRETISLASSYIQMGIDNNGVAADVMTKLYDLPNNNSASSAQLTDGLIQAQVDRLHTEFPYQFIWEPSGNPYNSL